MMDKSPDANHSFNAQLISLIVHELRNPLTAIKGYSELLLQDTAGSLNEKQVSFVRMIHSNSSKMADLITMLSDISRLQSGKLNFSIAPLPLKGYVEQSIRNLEKLAREKYCQIQINPTNDLLRAEADPHKLSQVLDHLLRNALQYSRKNSKVVISIQQNQNAIRVQIADQGIGIAKEYHEKIFTPFFREMHKDFMNVEGWGLGLYLCRNLLESMDGRIGFSSVQDQGSQFWFELPGSEMDG